MAPAKPIEILHEIFSNIITVQSISTHTRALKLASAKKKCHEHNFDVHLVRNNPLSDLQLYEKESDSTRPLNEKEVISDSTSLYDTIQFLRDQPFLFIKEKREITRIVTKADIDSIPIRIWLFGMISLLEWQLRKHIVEKKIEWEKSLSHSRLARVKKLYADKTERNEEVEMIDCTQLIDLSTIMRKNWHFFKSMFIGQKKAKVHSDFFKINKLRDSLAHSLRLEYEWTDIHDIVHLIASTLKKL